MYKLSEQMPINIWEEIAFKVQALDMSDGSPEEFKRNLELLKKSLVNLDICLDELKREPQYENEIGLAALLNTIYTSDASNTQKKSRFYEQIFTLAEIGINSIEFMPDEFYGNIFYDSIQDLKKISSGDSIIIDKFFTDGEFVLERETSRSTKYYDVYNLRKANYILNIVLSKNKSQITVEQAAATLKNFNGLYPTKNEIMNMNFAKINIPEQEIAIDEVASGLTQVYDKFDLDSSSFIKRLILDTNGQYYYGQK